MDKNLKTRMHSSRMRVPPAPYRTGVGFSLTETPPDRDPPDGDSFPGQRTPQSDKYPPGHRPPQPLDTDPRQRSLGTDTASTETPSVDTDPPPPVVRQTPVESITFTNFVCGR